VDFDERIHAPIEGTPLPAEAHPGPPVEPPPVEPPPAEPSPAGPTPADAPPAAVPSSYGTSGPEPSFAVAKYNPRTGEYLGTDGKWHRQANLVTAPPQDWKQLLPLA
jgi:hypothetical protein